MSAPVGGVRAVDMVCKTEGCGRPCLARGLCGRCYQRFRASPDFTPADTSARKCSIDGCEYIGPLKLGWCTRHYQRWRKYGDPEYPPQPNEGQFKPRPVDDEGRLRCSRCKEWLPIDRFRIEKHRGGRPSSTCKQCRAADFREWRKTHPLNEERYRRRTSASRYGLTVEEYEGLFDAQKGRCGICGQIPERRLHVDHDHDTGKVRGLLCGNCNRGLGMFQHDPRVMQIAIAWLETHDLTGDSL